MNKKPLDELEELLGISQTDRLIEATHEALKVSGMGEVFEGVSSPLKKELNSISIKFQLDPSKFIDHVKWFSGLQNHV